MNACPPFARGEQILEITLGEGMRLLWDRPVGTVASGLPTELLILTDGASTRWDVKRHLTAHGVDDPFVHLGLAGAALDALAGPEARWLSVFWDSLAVAISLDRPKVLHVLDPRGPHGLRRARAAIAERFPGMAMV